MNKGDPCPPASHTWLFIDQASSRLLQMRQRRLDVGYSVCHVVKALPMPIQEFADRGVGSQRLEQLYERAADGNHRLLYPLLLDNLPVDRVDEVPLLVGSQRCVEVTHCNSNVVQVEQSHPATLPRRREDPSLPCRLPSDQEVS